MNETRCCVAATTIFSSSVVAAVGSELDHKIKAAAAELEPAWKGMGKKVETRVWRIEKFQVKAWPQELYGHFHKGDSYIVLNTYKKNDNTDALAHDVHIWIGNESTQDEYGTAGTCTHSFAFRPLFLQVTTLIPLPLSVQNGRSGRLLGRSPRSTQAGPRP